eukprot:TRINITY_DN8747_c0_g1_i1.p1 TRINITY_DN8747_c0_g1~~TRINITY_DN8747_c0_g1_i1.p1  ORF type:complete len:395 (+),score=93.40 TRINITY_DN8747_c0_g1_i1:73-1185(+)
MGCRSSKMAQLEVPSARGRKHSRGTTPVQAVQVRRGCTPVINSRESSLDRRSEYSQSSECDDSIGVSSEQLSTSSVMTAATVAIGDVVDGKYVGLNSEDLKDVPIRTLLHMMKASSCGGAYDFSDLPLRAFLGLLTTAPPVHHPTPNISTEDKQPIVLKEYISEAICQPAAEVVERKPIQLKEYTIETVSQKVVQNTPVVLKEFISETIYQPVGQTVNAVCEEASCQTEAEFGNCSAGASPVKKPPLPSPSLSSTERRTSLGSMIAASSPLQLPATAFAEQHQQQVSTPKKKRSTRKSSVSPALRSTPQTPIEKPQKTSKRKSSPGKSSKKAPTVHLQPCLQMKVKVLQKREKNTYRSSKKEKRPVARAL